MTTEKFKCYICGRLKSSKNESLLEFKGYCGDETIICKKVCIRCLRKIYNTNIIEVLNRQLREKDRIKVVK